jgi:hypothetical protein
MDLVAYLKKQSRLGQPGELPRERVTVVPKELEIGMVPDQEMVDLIHSDLMPKDA